MPSGMNLKSVLAVGLARFSKAGSRGAQRGAAARRFAAQINADPPSRLRTTRTSSRAWGLSIAFNAPAYRDFLLLLAAASSRISFLKI